MPTDSADAPRKALTRIPGGAFILTAAHDGRRSGVLVRWVQQCSIKPPMVTIALPLGQPVEPLIRDSRSFGLCQIADDDQFLLRKFAEPPDRDEDPFDAIDTELAPSGSPIISRAMSFLDCELIRHVDLETDHRLYVGRVHDTELFRDAAPVVSYGSNGFQPAQKKPRKRSR